MSTNPKIDTNDPAQVESARALVVQHLQEAHATEQALVTNLRAHIAMTPRGSYDDLTAREIAQRVRDADEATAQKVRDYEGRHQRRVEVLEAASRQLSGSSS